jgi:hypothetical protein
MYWEQFSGQQALGAWLEAWWEGVVSRASLQNDLRLAETDRCTLLHMVKNRDGEESRNNQCSAAG